MPIKNIASFFTSTLFILICVLYMISALLTGCATTREADVKADCIDIAVSEDEMIKGCGMPAGVLCFMKGESLSCFQLDQGRGI